MKHIYRYLISVADIVGGGVDSTGMQSMRSMALNEPDLQVSDSGVVRARTSLK